MPRKMACFGPQMALQGIAKRDGRRHADRPCAFALSLMIVNDWKKQHRGEDRQKSHEKAVVGMAMPSLYSIPSMAPAAPPPRSFNPLTPADGARSRVGFVPNV